MKYFTGLALELFIQFSIIKNSFVFIYNSTSCFIHNTHFVSYSNTDQVSLPTIALEFSGGSKFTANRIYELVQDTRVSVILLLATILDL